jgi:hypothetical protein
MLPAKRCWAPEDDVQTASDTMYKLQQQQHRAGFSYRRPAKVPKLRAGGSRWCA